MWPCKLKLDEEKPTLLRVFHWSNKTSRRSIVWQVQAYGWNVIRTRQFWVVNRHVLVFIAPWVLCSFPSYQLLGQLCFVLQISSSIVTYVQKWNPPLSLGHTIRLFCKALLHFQNRRSYWEVATLAIWHVDQILAFPYESKQQESSKECRQYHKQWSNPIGIPQFPLWNRSSGHCSKIWKECSYK
jgi:hypothetical protein